MESRMKFSIIVPVYNGEKHIEKCIDQLLKQTYKNIEIIIIDDGSIDKTWNIVSLKASLDNRIIPIRTKNGGVSMARNIGIKISHGDYILFVDSDDYLVVDAVERLFKLTYEKKYDFVLFGFTVEGDNSRKNDTEVLNKLTKEIDNIKIKLLKRIISTKDNVCGYIWRAMYASEMLKDKNILFPEGIKISEDYMFLLDSILNSNRILICNEELYLYKIGCSSMSTKYVESLLSDMNFVNEWMYRKIVNKNKEFYDGFHCCVSNTYLRYVQNIMKNSNLKLIERHLLIKENKKKYNFELSIRKVWYKTYLFDLKSSLGVIMFNFNLEIVYEILFLIKLYLKG